MNNQQILDIANQYGTPTYVYDMQIIRDRIQHLIQDIGHNKDYVQFLYAVKANFNPTLVKEIIAQGCGIDAVSPEEVQLALHCGSKREDVMFTGNNMTDEEMVFVHELGVLLNIGSLSRLEKFGKAFPGSRVSVRFNPNVGSASHESNITGGPDSKFGVSFKDVGNVKEIVQKYDLHVVGVHQHIGSGWLGLREPILALDVILEIASQFDNLEFVDVGGGFGIPYKPDQTALDMKLLGEKIHARFDVFTQEYGKQITLRFEPGRYIVAESGKLITRVNTIKQSINRKTIVGTDTGMHHLVRVAMYGSYHPISNISHPEGTEQEYDITGNICECADFFAKDRSIPEIREGDILSIDLAGAYGMSMATHYQFRGLPAEVVVDGDEVRVIRRREIFEDIMAMFYIST